MDLEKSFDTKRVAEFLSVTERQVRDLCLKGELGDSNGLKGWKLGNKWRIAESDLKAFIAARSKAVPERGGKE